ncbi:MAG: nucleotidyltransferase family protein [Deltaproteobacteria bacterium]|nr:nucleotidyltransferase family protein [Deltaproteobacteria bacterium]
MNLNKAQRAEIARIAASHGARNVRLFGSHARGEPTPSIDVDLLVELAPESTLLDLIAIKQDVEDLLGCSVDVVTEAAVSPYLRDEVLKSAVPL